MAYLKGVNLSASSNIDGTAANFTSISGSSISGSFTGSFIGNIVGTASRATVANISNTALTASYIDGANVDGAVLTASFASTGDGTFSGSFSGSFTGDGSNLTGVTAAGTLSSSAQIASDISGAFGAPSASFSTRITAQETFSSSLDATFATEAELNASSSALTTAYTTADTTLSSSLAADIATNVSNITTNSSSAASDIAALQSDSASFSTRITSNDADISSLQSDSASFSTRITSNDADISALQSDSSSFSTRITSNDVDIAALVADSSSFSTRVTSNESFSSSLSSTIISYTGSFSGDGSNLTGVVAAGTISSSAQIASDISGAFTADSASLAADITTNSASIATLDNTTVKLTGDQSIAGTKTFTGDISIQGTASINHLETIYETSSVIYSSGSTKFGDTLDDTHIRTGSLLITGSSYTINGEDIIITSALNASTSSLSSSLAIGIASNSSSAATDIAALVADSASFSTRITSNDADISALQSDSSSFSTRITSNDADIAALQSDSSSFSTRITSNDADISALQSDSSSFSTRITSNDVDIAALQSDSSSFSTRVTDLETFSSSLDNTFATEAELNTATASLSSSLATDIATNSASIAAIDSFPYTGSAIISGSLTVTGSTEISGSVTAHSFNIDPTATGTPTLYSPTILNLSASDAVVVTSSPFRVASLTTTERGTFTAQDGDIIFNTTVGKYQVYSGSAWTNILQTEDKYDEIAVTVVNDGGNKYAFDGVTAPKLSLNKGTTYRFDLSDSSNSGHPFAFRLPDNTSYTTGVTTVGTAGSTGAYVEFDVDFATSSSLKYYCTVHGNGMGNVVQLIDLYDLVATGSLQGTATTASYVTTAQTASYVTTAQTASYVAASGIDGTVTSASYAITASFAENAGGTDTGSLLTTASATNNTITFTKGDSSTFNVTVATGSGGGGGSGDGFPYTGSAEITGSLTVIGGSISGDGSGLTNVSASIAENTLLTASFTNSVSEVVSHSFDSLNVNVIVYDTNNTQIIPSDITLTDSNTATVTFAATSSGHIVVTKGGHIVTGVNSFNTIVNNPFTSGSGASITASGHLVPDTHEAYDLGSSTLRWRDLYLSGSTINLGGTEISADADGHVEFHVGSTRKKLIVDELIIGSNTSTQRRLNINNGRLRVQTDGGSETEVDSAATASYVEASNIDGTVTSASYAITASYAENAGGGSGFPFTGSAEITGSLNVTGSVSFPRFDSTAGTPVFSSADTLNQSKAGVGGAGASSTAGIVFGGYVGPSYSNCTEEYDGTSFSTGGTLITARQQMKGAGTLTAAIGTGGQTPSTISNTEEYDGSSWATGGAMINTRRNHAAGGTQNAGLAYGGYGTADFNTATEHYDGSAWSAGGTLIVGRAQHGGAGTQNSSLLIGGRGPGYSNSYFNCTEEYDGSSWTVGTNTIYTSYWRSAAAASANAYLAGHGAGTSGTPTVISNGETWNGSSWSSAGSFIRSRNQTSQFGNSTSAVFAGGYYPATRTNCTEEFSPPGSYIPGFVYDKDTGTTTSTSFVESSALRYKEDIKPLNSQLDKVMQLKPVSYTWSPTQDQHIGLVAEEVNKLYPEFVGHNNKGEIEGIQYSKMVSVLIQSIQEQQQQINELKNIIKENK